MNEDCEHEWVYQNQTLPIHPPQQRRICRKCGKKETITLGPPHWETSEYEELELKFNKKNYYVSLKED